MKNLLLGSCFLICLMGTAWADSCPSTYPVLYGGQCCTTASTVSKCLNCNSPVCVAPIPTPTTTSAPPISNATVKYVPVPVDDGISAVIPAEKNLPKDPGAAGDATVAGVITNPYGVRDDVMRGIAYAYPKNPKAQTILFNMAKDVQAILNNATDVNLVMQKSAEIAAWEQCLNAATGEDEVWDSTLRPLILTTADRSRAFISAMDIVKDSPDVPDVTVQCP